MMESKLLSLSSEGLAFLHPARGEPNGITLVLLNAGLIHRVGPFRLHVDMAEHLTERGVNVVRLDFPGAGDARMAPLNRMDWLSGVLDAIEHELKTDTTFHVGGLCSAADHAWKFALVEPRVQGLLLLDPRALRGLPFTLGKSRLLKRKIQRDGVARTFSNMARKLLGSRTAAQGAQLRDWTNEAEFIVGNRALAARKIKIFALYTGAVTSYFTNGKQAATTFGDESEKVRLRHFEEIDHTFLRVADRDQVIAEIGDWLGSQR